MTLLFDFDFRKRVCRPDFKNQQRRVVCLTFARRDKDRLARCGLAPKAIPLRCDCCATVCRDFIIGWDLLHAEWIGLCAACALGRGVGHVLLCKVLSGSGYRLRPTSKIGEFTRDSGSRERSNGYIVSAARQARCLPDRIRKTSRRVDRPERALVAPTKAKELSRSVSAPP